MERLNIFPSYTSQILVDKIIEELLSKYSIGRDCIHGYFLEASIQWICKIFIDNIYIFTLWVKLLHFYVSITVIVHSNVSNMT